MGLEHCLEPAPVPVEGLGPLCRFELFQGRADGWLETAAGDRPPVEAVTMPLHIHPDRPPGVEAEQHEVGGVGHVEVHGGSGEGGFPMGAGLEPQDGGRQPKQLGEQHPQDTTPEQEAITVVRPAEPLQALKLLLAQDRPQVITRRWRQSPAVDQPEARRGIGAGSEPVAS
jgi:hypothetical protein